jgi:signal transduction histidine kinase
MSNLARFIPLETLVADAPSTAAVAPPTVIAIASPPPKPCPASAQTPVARRHSPLDDRRRSFLRMVSHELRTPLNSVIGFSEIISRELYGPIGNPKYRDHAAVIRDSGQKLLKLVNQVLEIARLDAGTADLVLRPESATAAVKQAANSLELEAQARNVSFDIEVAADTPLVLADARGLNTVLTNLLQNAIAFSPEGGVVHVDVRPRGGGVHFRITDQGEGLNPADLPRLMRPFEQGENALTRRSQGAGLGLPICQLLCQDMGGKLRLHTAPGKGLTALVRLAAAVGQPYEA